MTQEGQTEGNSATTKSSPHWLRHYFDGLRCPLCGDFYIADASSPKSPQHLHCGSAMCKECFGNQKALKSEERAHKCHVNYTTCFSRNDTAFYLFDVITYFNDKILAEGNDFIESLKEPRFLECPTCSELYSMGTEATTPFHFICGHMSCFACYKKMRLYRTEEENKISNWIYKVKCTRCECETCLSWERPHRNEMHEFLQQLDRLKNLFNNTATETVLFNCCDCARKVVFDDVWYCETCDKLVCGTCSMLDHRAHSVVRIAGGQIRSIAPLKTPIVQNQFKTYKEMIPHHLSTVNEAYDKYIQAMNAGMQRTDSFRVYEDAQAHASKLLSLGDRFEKISEEVMPVIRKYKKDITDIVGEIDQCAPSAKKKKADEEPKNV